MRSNRVGSLIGKEPEVNPRGAKARHQDGLRGGWNDSANRRIEYGSTRNDWTAERMVEHQGEQAEDPVGNDWFC